MDSGAIEELTARPAEVVIDLPDQRATIKAWSAPDGVVIRSTGLSLDGDTYHLSRAQLLAIVAAAGVP